MSDRTTTTGVQVQRMEEFNKGWDSSATAQELSDDLLSIPSQFPLYDKTRKLSVLLSMLHIRKGEFPAKRGNMIKVCPTFFLPLLGYEALAQWESERGVWIVCAYECERNEISIMGRK